MGENPRTKQEFLDELARHLRKLPEGELADALSYYEEYFDEAGEERFGETLDALGSPREIAVRILSERTASQIDAKPERASKSFSAIGTVILGIFAAPIALPLAIAAAAVLFAVAMVLLSLIIAAAAVLFSLVAAAGAVVVSLSVAGFAHAIAGAAVFIQSPLSGLFFLGSGACMMGLGVASFPVMLWLGKKAAIVCRELFGRRFPRWISRMIPGRRAAK